MDNLAASITKCLAYIMIRATHHLSLLYRRAAFGLTMRKVAARDRLPPKRVGAPLDGYLEELSRNGIFVLKDFFTAEQLKTLRASVERVAQQRAQIKRGPFVRDEPTLRVAEGTLRFWNVDMLSPEVRELFTKNPTFDRLADAYFNAPARRQSTIYQETRPSPVARLNLELGRQGFHFDHYSRTLKIFLYLEDVAHENGPFTYIKGSAGIEEFGKARKMYNYYLENLGLYSADSLAAYYTAQEEEAYQLWRRAEPVTGRAGTLIFAETRGLHVAGEIKSGVRKVLVNSYRA